MTGNSAAVAIYDSHKDAEWSIKAVERSGFDMKKLSMVCKDPHTEEHVVDYYYIGDRMKFWGKRGALLDRFCGLPFGSAFFMVPGIGSLIVFGPMVGWIAGGLEGTVVVDGVVAQGAGLSSTGMSKDSVIQYESALKSDKYLVIAHGITDEVAQTNEILNKTGAANVALHEGLSDYFVQASRYDITRSSN